MSGDKQQLLAMGFEEARIDCELFGLRTTKGLKLTGQGH
jgi:hypothetical protein